MQRIIYLTTFLLISLTIQAQYLMDVPVSRNGIPLKHATAGGLNLPQFSEVDLNNDGIKDLLVYDRWAQVASTFINNGTANQVDYVYAPAYMKRFPQDTRNFMLMRDYNRDGIEDIFFFNVPYGTSGGVGVWKGSYDINDTIQFVEAASILKYDFNPWGGNIFVFNPDLPAIDDIDNDGDMDIITFPLDFTYNRNVSWYKNTSVDSGYGSDSLHFVLEHQCWGMFAEAGLNNTIVMSPSIDSCRDNPWWGKSPRHVGSSLTAIDYNGDGTKDMVMGDVQVNSLNMMTGTTINDTILITSQDPTYPTYDTPVDLYSFPSAFFLDVNNDGKTDMIASPTETGYGEAVMDSVAWYYQNTVSNSNMTFNFQQKDFLVGDMVDLGQDAYPAFFDYNGDGLLDIVVGSFGYCRGYQNYEIGLTLFENVGTPTNPAFNQVDNNYAGLDSININGLHPCFGDLDGDGDQDMLLGTPQGTLVYVRNKGGAGATAVWDKPTLNYANISVNATDAAPYLVDLDRDNDLDLLVGVFNGTIKYYENTGSALTASFSNTPTSAMLGNFSLQSTGSRKATPCVYDRAGSYELYLGHQFKGIAHFNNIDGNILGTYDTLSLNAGDIYTGHYEDLDIADINADGFPDMVIGNSRGGISFYTEKKLVTSTPIVQESQRIVKLFPNPAKNQLTVTLADVNKTEIVYTIYNLMGQEIESHFLPAQAAIHRLNIEQLNSGIYLLNMQVDGQSITQKFIKH